LRTKGINRLLIACKTIPAEQSAGFLSCYSILMSRGPNFTRLDSSRPDIAVLIEAMVQARQVVARRSWRSPQEPINDFWWADVLADPRGRRPRHPWAFYGHQGSALHAYYVLADEPRPIIEVACTKCDWKAAFSRADLIAAHGAAYPLPDLLKHLASPTCDKTGHQWDGCGVRYVNPID
jgi:hypothetical protein